MLKYKCCMYIYIYMSMYFSDFHESRDSLCVLLWEVWFRHGRPVELKNVTSTNVVSLLWPLQTEDGCHQSKREKNTLFKPFSSDCGMTRFQAYQTLIYIIWALRLTPLYHWFFFSEFRKMYWQHFESLYHKWLNELCQTVFSDCFKKSVQNCRIVCISF